MRLRGIPKYENRYAVTEEGRVWSYPKHYTSGYVGVTWDKQRSLWMAKIKVDRKTIYIGRFKTPLEAHNAYLIRAKELHGRTNKSLR